MTHSEALRLITIARNEQRITQVVVAEQLRVAVLTVSHWERGRRGISCTNLAAYARLIGVEAGACCD